MKPVKSEIAILIIFIFLFVFIRSLNFSLHLNFSFDQAWGSARALEIWKNKEFTLVGPGSSLIVNGKQILQGSINYYFLLVFLLLGNFDPIMSSFLFMLFAALMSVPLYYGVKLLFNQKVAFMTLALYSLLPLYIDFTRFFFGPGFQLTLLPLLILFMGLYQKNQNQRSLFLVFFMIGVISQFHYATLIFLPIFFIYYLIIFRAKEHLSPPKSRNLLKLISFSVTGFAIGFSPIIIFELKNRFYNLTVFLEYLKYAKSVKNFALLPHRYLSLSLMLFIFIAGYFKKNISNKLIVIFLQALFLIDLFIYFPKPKQAFGMADNWNYLMEKKAYEIIKYENLSDYNVANLIYDNLSVVIKYQMKKDGIKINYDDYYHNEYLFIIDKSEENIVKNPAYEVKTFTPRKKLKQWKLNDFYNLYLFERVGNTK